MVTVSSGRWGVGLKCTVNQLACRTLNGSQSKTTTSHRRLRQAALGTVNQCGGTVLSDFLEMQRGGVRGLTSKVRNSCQRDRELISEAFYSRPRSSESQNVSKLLALSSTVDG